MIQTCAVQTCVHAVATVWTDVGSVDLYCVDICPLSRYYVDMGPPSLQCVDLCPLSSSVFTTQTDFAGS